MILVISCIVNIASEGSWRCWPCVNTDPVLILAPHWPCVNTGPSFLLLNISLNSTQFSAVQCCVWYSEQYITVHCDGLLFSRTRHNEVLNRPGEAWLFYKHLCTEFIKPNELDGQNFEKLFTPHHMSNVRRHMSGVSCQV